MIERTLVLLKPDAVQRAFAGEIISRFERVGLKIIGMKMKYVTEDFAMKHYTEDITRRRGEKVRKRLMGLLREGPVIAMVLEGVSAIEIVRKMVGTTEPKSAAPGTIRGDYSHISFEYADKKGIAVKNMIHASADKKDAEYEVKLWFDKNELHSYKTVHEVHLF